ncbi:MAG: GH32 C-terminal domain-containing protein, partial [Lewinella sp.]|nr:GH32 C-terminal domain-containing protein [Lewinella sp.]
FDGSQFTLLPEMTAALSEELVLPEGVLFADFEGSTYGNWQISGTAFGTGPANGTLPGQQPVSGFLGQGLVNTFISGDAPQGSLTSPPFTVNHNYIHFLIGGGNHPGATEIRLLINGTTVRSATGSNEEHLRWESWEMDEFAGQTAQLQIVDYHSGGWGHINIDHILFADEPIDLPREAFWADYGPDHYAGRSWVNMPADSTERIWLGWMNNWSYAGSIPTHPWRGSMTLPRVLSLGRSNGQLRLRQQAVEALHQLRGSPLGFTGLSVSEANSWLADQDFPDQSGEILLEIVPAETGSITLNVLSDGVNYTRIGYDQAANEVWLDRSQSGNVSFSDQFFPLSRAPLEATPDTLRLQVFVDQSSVEVFVNDGEAVMTARVFPPPGATDIVLATDYLSASLPLFVYWPLSSVWGVSRLSEPAASESALQVYPNPSRSGFLFTSDTDLVDYSLFNLQGELMTNIHYTGGTRRIRVDPPADLPAGVYLFSGTTAEGGSIQQKVILQR